MLLCVAPTLLLALARSQVSKERIFKNFVIMLTFLWQDVSNGKWEMVDIVILQLLGDVAPEAQKFLKHKFKFPYADYWSQQAAQ